MNWNLTGQTIVLYLCPGKDNQKLPKFISKGFEISTYWNEYKTKSEIKSTTSEHRYFLESIFVGVTWLFVLVYLNKSNDVKRYSIKKYYLPKGIIKTFKVIINGKNFQVIRQELYNRMFVRIWIHKKSL